jgi:hypothetical protein
MPGAIVHIAGGPDAEDVMTDTWGHLKAHPGVQHHGVIVFAEAAFGGERVILHADFGPDAGYGPWFYEHAHEWLWGQDTEPGEIYTFSGWYRTDSSGDHEFHGEVTSAPLAERSATVAKEP